MLIKNEISQELIKGGGLVQGVRLNQIRNIILK